MTGLGDRHVRKSVAEWRQIVQALREDGYHDVAVKIETHVRNAESAKMHQKIVILNADEDIVVREAGARAIRKQPALVG